MVKVFIYLGLILFSTLASGQNQAVVDSLRQVLQNQNVSCGHTTLYSVAVEYVDFNNELALRTIEQTEQAALMGEDSFAIVRSSRLKGQILFSWTERRN